VNVWKGRLTYKNSVFETTFLEEIKTPGRNKNWFMMNNALLQGQVADERRMCAFENLSYFQNWLLSGACSKNRVVGQCIVVS